MAISAADRAALIRLARAAVHAEVANAPLPHPPPPEGILGEPRGCFVTLTNRGRLRGCIGTFQPRQPLGLTIIEMARAAARDPRFIYTPVSVPELANITLEISVLSALEETSDPASLEIGRHGIYIVRGSRSGCFLPEVAVDQGWDTQRFLNECCTGKAGLPPESWKADGTKVYLFTSEKFEH